MKAVFGEYAAYTTPGGVRFQKDGKLISVKSVPPEVVQFLEGKVTGERGRVEPKQPDLYEKLEGKPAPTQHIQSEDTPTLTEIDVLERAKRPPEHLTMEDFADDPDFQRGLQEAENPAGTHPVPEVDPNFLESVSIHTAPIEDIARALYERFGLYTVYLGQLPNPDEINPLTGEGFTKYHLGIAYQAAIRAQNVGIKSPEANRAAIDQGRDASQNFHTDPVPATLGQARAANSFAFRTSVMGNKSTTATQIVHERDAEGNVRAVQVDVPVNGTSQHYDEREDEFLVEPNFSGKPVIRPDW